VCVCVCVCVSVPASQLSLMPSSRSLLQVCVVIPGLPDADVQTLPPAGYHRQAARA